MRANSKLTEHTISPDGTNTIELGDIQVDPRQPSLSGTRGPQTRGSLTPTIIILIMWTVPTVLLAALVANSGTTNSSAPALATVDTIAAAIVAADVASPPPAAAPSTPAPVDLHRGLGAKLNEHSSSRFFDVYFNSSTGKLTLDVPASALGVDFVVMAFVSQGDGTEFLYHQPQTSQDNVFKLKLSPSGQALDLVEPNLLLRAPSAVGSANTISADLFEQGTWAGWKQTFSMTPIACEAPPSPPATPMPPPAAETSTPATPPPPAPPQAPPDWQRRAARRCGRGRQRRGRPAGSGPDSHL